MRGARVRARALSVPRRARRRHSSRAATQTRSPPASGHGRAPRSFPSRLERAPSRAARSFAHGAASSRASIDRGRRRRRASAAILRLRARDDDDDARRVHVLARAPRLPRARDVVAMRAPRRRAEARGGARRRGVVLARRVVVVRARRRRVRRRGDLLRRGIDRRAIGRVPVRGHRGEMAEALGGEQDVQDPGPDRHDEAEVLRAGHVPVPQARRRGVASRPRASPPQP